MTRTAPARSIWLCAGVFAVLLVLTTLISCVMRKAAAPEYFTAEEKRLTAKIDGSSDPDVLSDLYARRARLRLRADNPLPDYKGAQSDLESSLSLNPRQWRAGDMMDWIAVLSRIAALEQDVSKFKAKYEQGEQRNSTLTGTVEQLEKQEKELRKLMEEQRKSIEELRKSIEELQSLELQMEQRRQQLR